ncbi:MAG: HlyC/CorC family transporter [Clostridia bacterium]|nr:HlyC/CorC family transporter [Clostridia bacterium]
MTNYIIIAICLVLSAFFSGSEIAYNSVNPIRLQKAAEEGSKKAKLTLSIYNNYDKFLSTILIGNNLVNIASSSVATVIFINLFGEVGAAYATLAMTVAILICGEITPKIVARTHSFAFANATAYPIKLLMIITFPLVWLVGLLVKLLSPLWGKDEEEEGFNAEELANLIEIAETENVIDEERGDLLQSAIDFSDTSAQEILTHRVDMIAIDIDDPMDEIIATLESSPYSRIPVYEDSIDNVIGILYLNHFYKKIVEEPDFSLRDILIEVCFIHKSMKLPAVLSELKRRKTHIAVVTDEYGGTMGIVTMEDVLEQLVGEIWDETDEVFEDITEVAENTFEVDGDMSIYDFLDEVGLDSDDFEGDYTTVGGWAIESIGTFPTAGESFVYENLTVTVVETEELRVTKLKAVVTPRQDDEE